MTQRVKVTLDLRGTLQGVGFRPTLARLTAQENLGGWCRNQSGTVRLVLIGPTSKVDRFVSALPTELPVQAKLDSIDMVERSELSPDENVGTFEILESVSTDNTRISIPADLVMCSDCKREVFDRESRFYRYPFTTCTNCGPRYTVVEDMPYDRERTSLKNFPLCPQCLNEYKDPADRRFHAESIACPDCGPRLTLMGTDRQIIDGDPIVSARAALADGKIVAVKGLGGFLLAADPFNRGTLIRLRERKHRPSKPFAVMARNIDAARRQCAVTGLESELLCGNEGPIVILPLQDNQQSLPIDLLTPGQNTLGVMLPTTPLHELLCSPLDNDTTPAFELLLMTSGNRGGEPICITNEEALERLTDIADLFLIHDREINLRNDDSICVETEGEPQVWRRSRGFAPRAISLLQPIGKNVFAMGAELKNTICLGSGRKLFVSPHIGDLETPEALDGMDKVIDRFPEYFKIEPQVVAVDLHPDMHATRAGNRLADKLDIPVVSVQHHHAHGAAVMAEHGIDECLALVYDGTGLGTDGSIWGAELLHINPAGFTRMGSFVPSSLLGGDVAVHSPVRQLFARWVEAGIVISDRWKQHLGISDNEESLWTTQIERGLGTPQTHAAGRLFDAFSVMIGTAPDAVSFEGQAAIWMEAAATGYTDSNPVEIPNKLVEQGGMIFADWTDAFARFADKPVELEHRVRLAYSFHRTLVDVSIKMISYGLDQCGDLPVVLTGGVMMNKILCHGLCTGLRAQKCDVLLSRMAPPNDGGISVGQALIAGGIE
ncbi:MAG: carbamoyltransferase HypF [Proteobacteria bacterium]|nr:carbamoyltransferase HypF [Pseudomonadota bacterium]